MLLTKIPAIVTTPVQKVTKASMIIVMRKRLDVNAAIGTKRPAEIFLDHPLLQEKGRFCDPLLAKWGGKREKLRRALKSGFTVFVRFVRVSLEEGKYVRFVECIWSSSRESPES